MLIKKDEVAEILNIKPGTAYKVIQKLNKELEKQGFITISGRISKDYLEERYGVNKK
jgi:hypothetical protein